MKKNTMLYIGIAAFAAIGYFIYSKAKTAGRLTFNFAGIKLGKMTGINLPDVVIQIKVVNPTNTPLNITSVSGDIFFNGKLFTQFSNFTKTKFTPNSESIYEVTAKTSTVTSFLALVYAIKNKKFKKGTVGIKATINSEGAIIAVDETKNITDLLTNI